MNEIMKNLILNILNELNISQYQFLNTENGYSIITRIKELMDTEEKYNSIKKEIKPVLSKRDYKKILEVCTDDMIYIRSKIQNYLEDLDKEYYENELKSIGLTEEQFDKLKDLLNKNNK